MCLKQAQFMVDAPKLQKLNLNKEVIIVPYSLTKTQAIATDFLML